LERTRGLPDRVCVEELAELFLAEELLQLRGIDRERLRPALGERGVEVVEEVRDVGKKNRGRKGRWASGVDGHDPKAPLLEALQDLDRGRQVEDVAQALAIRLEDDREGAEARGDRQEIRRALSEVPERAAPPGVPPRQQQRPARVFPEVRREERRVAERLD